ncbi:MAG: hypothetical protein DI561_03955 [Thauera sp.]|nr:MAG: hypothetical protein DI561_03955 [Thauera sp.]
MNNIQKARRLSPLTHATVVARFRPLALALAFAAAAPAAVQAIELTDLEGVEATASSCYLGCGNAHYDAGNILDGDYGATGNTGLNAWNSGFYGGHVDLDLTAVFVLDRIELYGVSPYYNPFTLSVSADGLGWTTVTVAGYGVEPDLPEAGVDGVRYGAVFDVADGSLASGLNARYLRYSVNAGSPQWGYLVEIDVQGHVATVPEPEAWISMLAGLGFLGIAARRRRA